MGITQPIKDNMSNSWINLSTSVFSIGAIRF